MGASRGNTTGWPQTAVPDQAVTQRQTKTLPAEGGGTASDSGAGQSGKKLHCENYCVEWQGLFCSEWQKKCEMW
jgi:hypothetical protein